MQTHQEQPRLCTVMPWLRPRAGSSGKLWPILCLCFPKPFPAVKGYPYRKNKQLKLQWNRSKSGLGASPAEMNFTASIQTINFKLIFLIKHGKTWLAAIKTVMQIFAQLCVSKNNLLFLALTGILGSSVAINITAIIHASLHINAYHEKWSRLIILIAFNFNWRLTVYFLIVGRFSPLKNGHTWLIAIKHALQLFAHFCAS